MKKRQVIPVLDDAIKALVALSSDCATLEVMDNDQASRRVKRDIASFKEKELKKLTDTIYGIRVEIKSRPKRKLSENQKNNLKPKQNESESESVNA